MLKILKEMLLHHAERFMPYVELTILRLLEFENDTDKEVSLKLFSSVVGQEFCLAERISPVYVR